jgi:glycopeptide antibiotics resistance protein
MNPTLHKIITWVTLALVLIALTVVTLGHAGPSRQAEVRLLPFRDFIREASCIVRGCPRVRASWRYFVVNGLGNVVVFMPLGMIMYVTLKYQVPALNRPVLYAMLFGALVSLVFEIVQLWIPGRATESDDVILNAAGTLLGSLAIKWGEVVLNRTE